MRVVLVDDAVLFREGVASLLASEDIGIVAQAADAGRLPELVRETRADLVIIDMRLPPTYTIEGLEAAHALRKALPGQPVLILSQSVEPRFADELVRDDSRAIGYLLKQRVTGTTALLDAVRRVATGGTIVDPEIATLLVSRQRRNNPLDRLTASEREILCLMVEGHTNQDIMDQLFLSQETVEAHVRRTLLKLDILDQPDDQHRVYTVLTYLQNLDH